jgi:hypothetical protein
MNRRNLLTAGALMVPVALLQSCGWVNSVIGGVTPTTQQIQQGEADVQLIDQALLALESFAGTLLGTTSATVTRYASYLNQAAAVATTIIAAGANATGPMIQKWETYLNAAVGALSAGLNAVPSTDPVLATIKVALSAAAALLPTIEAAFNILVPAQPTAAMMADHEFGQRALASMRLAAAMSAEDARKVLAGVLAAPR